MNWCVYNILSIQNIQKYLKNLIQSMYGQRVKNKYPLNKNILKYLIYSLTGVWSEIRNKCPLTKKILKYLKYL